MTASFITLAMAGQGQGGQQMSPVGMIGWFVIMIAIFYFILIRPQQRREKERRALIEAVKTGDRVLFAGGIIGTVSNCKEKTLVIKIADNVKIEVSRASVSQVLGKGEQPDDKPAA